jgi:hypothetical protein
MDIYLQGCRPGSGWIRIDMSCWVRMRIWNMNPDPSVKIALLAIIFRKVEVKHALFQLLIFSPQQFKKLKFLLDNRRFRIRNSY